MTIISSSNKTSSIENITCFPNHIAIIMDGNGRWAERRGVSRLEGHKAGLDNIQRTLKCLNDVYGIKYVTIYSFSTENWSRPEDEVHGLLQLLEDNIDEEARELHINDVKMRHLGRLEELPRSIQLAINRAVQLTENNTGMTFSFAFNYGGRLEILDAIRRIIADNISPQEIDESLFNSYLYTAGLPDVDLLIRTSGELRLSNFLVWQAAYSEYYFTKILWPDFGEEELRKALLSYSRRIRRFGGL